MCSVHVSRSLLEGGRRNRINDDITRNTAAL